jgi:para-nitrobenzyl esterase
MPDFAPLAYHTADLQYLFPRWHGGNKGNPHDLSPKQKALSHALVKVWSHFARTGNPSGRGNAPWPAYGKDPAARVYLAQNIGGLSTFSDADFTARHTCDFWRQGET